MAKAMYSVVGGTTKKIKNAYAVIGGVTKQLKAVYGVIDGTTRLIWKSGGDFNIDYPFEGILAFCGSDSTESDRDVIKFTLDSSFTGTYVINRSQSTSGYNMKTISKNGKTILVKNWLYNWNENTQAYEIRWSDAFRPSVDIKTWLDYTNGDGMFGQPAITRDGKYVVLVYFCTSEYEDYIGKGFRVYSCPFGDATRATFIGAINFTSSPRLDSETYAKPSSQSYAKVSCSDDISTIAACGDCGAAGTMVIYKVTDKDVENATRVTYETEYDGSITLCEVSADGKYVFKGYQNSSGRQIVIYTISETGSLTRIYNDPTCEVSLGSVGTKKLIDYGNGYFDIIYNINTTSKIYSYFIQDTTVTYLGQYTTSGNKVITDLSLDKQNGVRIYNKTGASDKNIGYCSISRDTTNLITSFSDIYTKAYTYVNYNPYTSVLLA